MKLCWDNIIANIVKDRTSGIKIIKRIVMLVQRTTLLRIDYEGRSLRFCA